MRRGKDLQKLPSNANRVQVIAQKQMPTMELEERLSKIEERNAIVEADKAWEKSRTRQALVMLFTYLAMSVYLWAIGVADPWLNGIVPAVAFMISTLTLPYFKREWLKHRDD